MVYCTEMPRRKLNLKPVFVVAVALLVSVAIVAQAADWYPPPAAFPSGNPNPPLDTGSAEQFKTGNLNVGTSGSYAGFTNATTTSLGPQVRFRSGTKAADITLNKNILGNGSLYFSTPVSIGISDPQGVYLRVAGWSRFDSIAVGSALPAGYTRAIFDSNTTTSGGMTVFVKQSALLVNPNPVNYALYALNQGGTDAANVGGAAIAVYGVSNGPGPGKNIGGFFSASGPNAIGLQVSGDTKIIGTGNGIIFPDGTKQTTAGGGGGGGTTYWQPAPAPPASPDAIYYRAGNVGIGTDNPKERVQIGDRLTIHDGGQKIIGSNFYYGGSPAADRRILANNVGVANIAFTQPDGGITFRTADPGAADSEVLNWRNVLTLTNGGNVGIGTDNPSEKLAVENGNLLVTLDPGKTGYKYQSTGTFVNPPPSDTTKYLSCDTDPNVGNDCQPLVYESVNRGLVAYNKSKATDCSTGPCYTVDAAYVYNRMSNTPVSAAGNAYIQSNVTIGHPTIAGAPSLVFTPGDKPSYTITNDQGTLKFLNSGGEAKLVVDQWGTVSISSAVNDKIKFYGTQTDPHTIFDGSGRGFRFWDSTNGELLRITNSGSVGIGTPTPGAGLKLDVGGDMRIQNNLRVDGNLEVVGIIPNGVKVYPSINGSASACVDDRFAIRYISGGTNGLSYFELAGTSPGDEGTWNQNCGPLNMPTTPKWRWSSNSGFMKICVAYDLYTNECRSVDRATANETVFRFRSIHGGSGSGFFNVSYSLEGKPFNHPAYE